MPKTEIRVEPVEEFFARGRKIARLADAGKPIPRGRIIAFADVESLFQVLTGQRVALLRQIVETPGSIAALAKELNRDRSAVARDVRVLERYGVVEVTERPLPGHGKQKWVTPVASKIQLTAVL